MSAPVERIVEAWPRVASVVHWAPAFEDGPGHDYPLSALPVSQESLSALNEEERAELALSLWIQYNRRTIDAEEYIANPAIDWLCRDGDLPLTMELALMQTAVDERYHTYFHRLALKEALGRSFVEAPFVRSITVRELLARQAECGAEWQRRLVQLAYAAVAEVSVNAFLEVLSKSSEIRASNRELVHMHNADESLHSVIFVEVVAHLLKKLPPEEAAFLVAEMERARDSFLKHDFSMYREVFDAHGFSLELITTHQMMSRDMSGVDELMASVAR